MQRKPQLPSPPIIGSGMENSNRRPTSVQDSLRFSYDFDIENAVELEEGKQIDFEFQQYPEYEFRLETSTKGENQRLNSTTDSSMTRKLQIFEKYRHKEQQKQNQSRNDIVESFDKIFNINERKLDESSSNTMFKKKVNNQLENTSSNNVVNFNNNLPVATTQDDKSTLSIEANNSNNGSNSNKDQNLVMKGQQQISINHSRKIQDTKPKNEPLTNANSSNLSPLNENFVLPTSQPLIRSNIPGSNNNFILGDPKKPSILCNSNNKQAITGTNYSHSQIQSSSFIENVSFPTPGNVQHSLSFINVPSYSSLPSNLTPDKIMTSSNIFSNMYTQYGSLQQGQGSRLVQPIFQEQLRIPPFIRKVRKFNSIYPNFNHPNINLEYESKYCNTLAKIFEQAFDFLEKLTYKALERTKQPKYFPNQLASLNYFLNSQWQKERIKQWNVLNENLRPRINFARTEIDESKIKSALANYKEVITYYKQRKIDLTSEDGIKSYFRIRQKFWSLQKNMRSISEDVYRIYQETQYPNFYYQYLKVLRSQLPSPQDVQLIRHHQEVLNSLLLNRQRMQPLSCSQVGQAVKVKLERQLKFLCPF